ncbi:MAG: hypothetical protein ACO27R_06865 [Hylemonella sp.]
MHLIQTADQIRALLGDKEVPKPCQCGLSASTGWQSISEERWPAHQMRCQGTLRDPDLLEPTFEELHPKGTRYESPDAPVAIRHFPYNRCDLWRCETCAQHLLRYTEFGGYYVDHRLRMISARTDVID